MGRESKGIFERITEDESDRTQRNEVLGLTSYSRVRAILAGDC